MISTRFTLAALLSLALAPCLAKAQGDKPTKPEPEAQPTQSDSKPPKQQPQPYLLTLTVKESDSGKPSVEKSYALIVIADDNRIVLESLRDDDNIPFKTENEQNYRPIGTKMDFTHATRQGETLIVVLSVSNESLTEKSNGINLPQNHEWRINAAAVLPPGKPTVVYSASDGITGHKVEILATAKLLDTK
jgi:hypothetical protein